jgi:hypothetical protein
MAHRVAGCHQDDTRQLHRGSGAGLAHAGCCHTGVRILIDCQVCSKMWESQLVPTTNVVLAVAPPPIIIYTNGVGRPSHFIASFLEGESGRSIKGGVIH